MSSRRNRRRGRARRRGRGAGRGSIPPSRGRGGKRGGRGRGSSFTPPPQTPTFFMMPSGTTAEAIDDHEPESLFCDWSCIQETKKEESSTQFKLDATGLRFVQKIEKDEFVRDPPSGVRQIGPGIRGGSMTYINIRVVARRLNPEEVGDVRFVVVDDVKVEQEFETPFHEAEDLPAEQGEGEDQKIVELTLAKIPNGNHLYVTLAGTSMPWCSVAKPANKKSRDAMMPPMPGRPGCAGGPGGFPGGFRM